MFQLRSFVHRRLYAAAEEILAEVERTITSVLYEASVHRQTEEPRGQPQKPEQISVAVFPLTSSAVPGKRVQQETPTQPLVREECDRSTGEVPGSSQTSADPENDAGNHCSVQIDFKIKEEQEEVGDDTQTQEAIPPFPEAMKREEREPDVRVITELPPLSSDGSVAQSETSDSEEEEWAQGEGTRASQRQNASTGQVADPPAKSQRGRSVCPVCGKGFQYVRPFMKHLKTHGRTSESTKELLSHLQSAHNKRLVCDVCGKKFTNPGCLHIHSKIHTGIKDFQCRDCGKSFVRKEHLVVHARTHSGERPYHCDVCGKAFTQSQNLTVHRRTHTGERPYRCGSCGKLFYTCGQLKKHAKRFSACVR